MRRVLALVLLLVAALLPETSLAQGLPIVNVVAGKGGATSYSLTLQLLGLMTVLTLFIMQPVMMDVYNNAILPYMNSGMPFEEALAAAEAPIRGFMLAQTREEDIAMFMEISRSKAELTGPESVPFTTLVPAFMTSELKSAFTIGFLIYIPFVVIDLIVLSVLMSMGMMMLSPMMISMPFKLMLFVLVDGWSMLMGSLASSFAMP